MFNSKKRKSLSLADKIKIIAEIENGKSQASLSREMEIPKTTIQSVWSARNKIRENSLSVNLNFKKVRKCEFSSIDEELYQWFNIQRARNITISGPILKEKALEIAKQKNLEFSASDGWLDCWKKRHGIVFKSASGEEAAVNTDLVNEWISTVWPSLSAGYSPDCIYNCDETGLFYRLLPQKTLDFKGKECHGGKQSKDRLTVMLCVNGDGSDKLKPLVIGKSARPRCFKNIRNPGSLPVTYASNTKAWMTNQIFKDWLNGLNRAMKLQNRKILLLLDNCSPHVAAAYSTDNVKLVFLPPNATSIVQPLDRGIINSFKVNYRKLLIKKLIAKLDAEDETKLDVLEAIYGIHSSWENVTPTCIKNCFTNAKILRNIDVIPEVPEPQPTSSMNQLGISEVTFEDYVEADSNLILFEELPSDAESNENEIVEPEINFMDEDGSDDEDHREKISDKEALRLVENLKFYLSCSNADVSLINNANTIEQFVLNQASQSLKQSKITDFLNN